MKSLRNSYALMKMSFGVIRKDARILLVQIFGLLVLGALVTLVGYGLYASGYFSSLELADEAIEGLFTPLSIAALILIYFVGMFVVYFTNACISILTLSVVRNQPKSIRGVVQNVNENMSALTQFTLISATVGVMLKALEERLPWVGALAVRFAHGAWNLGTVFAVVSIVDGQSKTGVEATRRSVSILVNTFGENVAVRVSLGVVVTLVVFVWLAIFWALLPILALVYLNSMVVAGSIAAFGILGLFAIIFLCTVFEVVLTAMLYEYVLQGKETSEMGKEMFKQLITTKKAYSVFNHA